MRILVYEFVTGGGLAGQAVPVSLAREGAAMRAAVLADLAAIGRHQIVTTADPRFPCEAPPAVDVVTLSAGGTARLDALIASVDAVWLVAPETGRCLERLAANVQRLGKTLLGSSADAIRRASDKEGLARRLARCGVAHPATCVLRPGADWTAVASDVGYPLVVKPRRGAGCQGVSVARSARDVLHAIAMARRVSGRREPLLMQRYAHGVAASVSLLADGHRAVPLMINAQHVHGSRPFSYGGGSTPLDHPLAGKAIDAAVRTCQALPGLRGYVGVDLVLTAADALVIEVNPRLTTAYLGVRSVVKENVAELAIAACEGHLPGPLLAQHRVRFTATGEVFAT